MAQRPASFASVLAIAFASSVATLAACVGDDPLIAPGAETGGDGGPGSSGGTTPAPQCTTNDECPTGFCTDGVCCNVPCKGQCESCSEPGKEGQCVAVSGVPRGDRTTCNGSGDPVCGGACDGAERTKCAYPTTECRAGACANNVLTAPASCVEGACPAVSTSACGDTTKTKYCGGSACVGVTQVVAGYDYSCALMTDQTVRCWGNNGSNQLGLGQADTDPRSKPTPVPGLTGVVKLTTSSSEAYRVCALLNDGTAKCWGSGASGALGDGDTSNHTVGVPTTVLKAAGTPFTGIKDIAVGQSATCALDVTGVAWCWGDRYGGAVGDGSGETGSRQYPFQVVNGGTGNSAISMGRWHACMTTTSTNTSSVKCWGENSGLGIGVTGSSFYDTAQTVPSFTIANGGVMNPLALGSPRNVSCVVLNNSTLGCWGGNTSGHLGRNVIGSASNSAVPTSVCRDAAGSCALMNLVKSASIGETFSCAVTDTNVRCWGRDNGYGSLGDGNIRTTANPVLNASIGPSFPVAAIQVAAGSYHACALLVDQTVRCWGWNSGGQLGNDSTANSANPVVVQF